MTTEIQVNAPNCLRQTHVDGGYVVSTIRRDESLQQLDSLLGVFTAIVGDIGRAELDTDGEYETMVFPGTAETGIQDWTEIDFRRYTTEAEALAGHDEMVEKWKAMPAGIRRELGDE